MDAKTVKRHREKKNKEVLCVMALGSKLSSFLVKCVPGLFIGAVAGGLIGGVTSHFNQAEPIVPQLVFHPEAFDMDPTCAQSFLNLQAHRHISPELFDEAGADADSLFCLEKQIAEGQVVWDHGDVFTSRRYVRQVFNNLNKFYAIAMERLYKKRYQDYLELENAHAGTGQLKQALQQVEDGKEMIRQMKRSIDEIKSALSRHEGMLARHLPSQEVMLPGTANSLQLSAEAEEGGAQPEQSDDPASSRDDQQTMMRDSDEAKTR
jgi:hypothetical protein